MPAEADSMTAFLRGYALEPHGSKVKYHTGKTKHAKTPEYTFSEGSFRRPVYLKKKQ